MTEEEYTKWLGIARRFSRRPDEGDDLLHDALLIAAEQGRIDLALEENRRWLTGVLRNRSAMTARTAMRVRDREGKITSVSTSQEPSSPIISSPSSFLLTLTPSIRRLALLILYQMPRHEIEHVLGITPVAYRQRLVALRTAVERIPIDEREEYGESMLRRRSGAVDDIALGTLRRALLWQLRHTGEGIGTHDPDGHPLLIRR